MIETITHVAELDIDPYTSENLLDPYPMHERVREAGPVVRLKPYPMVVACARHEQVRSVLTNHATFISSAGVGLPNFNQEAPFRPQSPILEAHPPLHTRTRGVLMRILGHHAVARLRAQFTTHAEWLVERCVSRVEIDGIGDLARVYPLQVFPDAVGLQQDGRENLPLYTDMMLNAMGPRNAVFEKSAERGAPVTRWVMAHCQRDRLAPGGFGDQVYQAAESGEITFEQATLLVRSLLAQRLAGRFAHVLARPFY
jgi:4-methoxybenzoate monooxygenase (O-demethylating)